MAARSSPTSPASWHNPTPTTIPSSRSGPSPTYDYTSHPSSYDWDTALASPIPMNESRGSTPVSPHPPLITLLSQPTEAGLHAIVATAPPSAPRPFPQRPPLTHAREPPHVVGLLPRRRIQLLAPVSPDPARPGSSAPVLEMPQQMQELQGQEQEVEEKVEERKEQKENEEKQVAAPQAVSFLHLLPNPGPPFPNPATPRPSQAATMRWEAFNRCTGEVDESGPNPEPVARWEQDSRLRLPTDVRLRAVRQSGAGSLTPPASLSTPTLVEDGERPTTATADTRMRQCNGRDEHLHLPPVRRRNARHRCRVPSGQLGAKPASPYTSMTATATTRTRRRVQRDAESVASDTDNSEGEEDCRSKAPVKKRRRGEDRKGRK